MLPKQQVVQGQRQQLRIAKPDEKINYVNGWRIERYDNDAWPVAPLHRNDRQFVAFNPVRRKPTVYCKRTTVDSET